MVSGSSGIESQEPVVRVAQDAQSSERIRAKTQAEDLLKSSFKLSGANQVFSADEAIQKIEILEKVATDTYSKAYFSHVLDALKTAPPPRSNHPEDLKVWLQMIAPPLPVKAPQTTPAASASALRHHSHKPKTASQSNQTLSLSAKLVHLIRRLFK